MNASEDMFRGRLFFEPGDTEIYYVIREGCYNREGLAVGVKYKYFSDDQGVKVLFLRHSLNKKNRVNKTEMLDISYESDTFRDCPIWRPIMAVNKVLTDDECKRFKTMTTTMSAYCYDLNLETETMRDSIRVIVEYMKDLRKLAKKRPMADNITV